MNHLIIEKIPFQVETDCCGYPQVFYPQRGNYKCSVICNDISYGGKQGLLEIMGLLTKEEEEEDCVVGYLRAENVLERIKKDYTGGK
jgi:hypothetical protein